MAVECITLMLFVWRALQYNLKYRRIIDEYDTPSIYDYCKKYEANFAKLYLISTFPALKIDIENYPVIKEYLETFGKRLEQTGEKGSRKKSTNKWFETQDNISFFEEFEKEKIIFSRIVRTPQFYYDNEKLYAEATSYIMFGKNLKYLLAFLNSDVVYKIFYKYYSGGGIDGEIKINKLENLPIPKIDEEKQKPFIELVDKILALKKEQKDTKELEDKIDEMVYKLYDLNEDEIETIKR